MAGRRESTRPDASIRGHRRFAQRLGYQSRAEPPLAGSNPPAPAGPDEPLPRPKPTSDTARPLPLRDYSPATLAQQNRRIREHLAGYSWGRQRAHQMKTHPNEGIDLEHDKFSDDGQTEGTRVHGGVTVDRHSRAVAYQGYREGERVRDPMQ